MKTLQNNFTTPEQSKRLLELGVPADSADCYIYTYDGVKADEIGILRKLSFTQRREKHGFQDRLVPCWSVGRLMEIYEIVGKEAPQCISTKKSCTRTENLVSLFEENALLLDFSKLEG